MGIIFIIQSNLKMIASVLHTYSSQSSSSAITSLTWWRQRISGDGFLFIGKSDGTLDILTKRFDPESNDVSRSTSNSNQESVISSSSNNRSSGASQTQGSHQSDFKLLDSRKKFSEDKSTAITYLQAVDKWNVLLCLIDGRIVSHSLSFHDDMKRFLEKEPPVYQNEKGCTSFDANVGNDTLIIGMKKRIIVLKRLGSSLPINIPGSSFFQLVHVINIDSGTVKCIASNYRNTWLALSEQYLIMNNDTGKIISSDLSPPLVVGLQKKPFVCIIRNDIQQGLKQPRKNLVNLYQNSTNSQNSSSNEVILLLCDSVGRYVSGDQAERTFVAKPSTTAETEFYFRAISTIQWQEPPSYIIAAQPYLVVIFPQSIDIYSASTGSLLQRHNASGYTMATTNVNDPGVGAIYDDNIPVSVYAASDKQIIELRFYPFDQHIISILDGHSWPSSDILPKYQQQQQQQSLYFHYNLSLSLCMDVIGSPWRTTPKVPSIALGYGGEESHIRLTESYIHGRYGLSLFQNGHFDKAFEHFHIPLTNGHVALEWILELFANTEVFASHDEFVSSCQMLRDYRIKRMGEVNRDDNTISNDSKASQSPSGSSSSLAFQGSPMGSPSIGNYGIICFDAPAKEGRMKSIPIDPRSLKHLDSIELAKAIRFILLPIIFQHRDSLVVARANLSGSSSVSYHSGHMALPSPDVPSSPVSAAKVFSLSAALAQTEMLSLNKSFRSTSDSDPLASRKRSVILFIEDELRIIDSIIFRSCVLTSEQTLAQTDPINLWDSKVHNAKRHITSSQIPSLPVRKTYFLLDNFCSIDECKKMLLIYPEAWKDVAWIYYGKGYHDECLSWLQKLGTKDLTKSRDVDEYALATVKYLQCLGPQHIQLIIKYSKWIFEVDTNMGLYVFIPSEKGFKFGFSDNDIRNRYARIGELDPASVVKYLNELDSSLSHPPKVPSELDTTDNYLEIRYLEYVIEKVRDDTAVFHNRLAYLYLDAYIHCSEQLKNAKQKRVSDDEINLLMKRKQYFQDRQVRFLTRSQNYSPGEILPKVKESDDMKSHAIVLNKMGRHLDALNVYAAESTQAAEEYCMKISSPTKREQVYLSLLSRVLGNQPPKPNKISLSSASSTATTTGWENNYAESHRKNDTDHLKPLDEFFPRRRVDSSDHMKSSSSNLEQAIALLNRKSSEFNPVQVMKALPDDAPVSDLLIYLETVFRDIEDKKNKNMIERQLFKQEHIRSKQLLIEQQQKYTIIKRTTVCSECARYFQDGVAFVRTPDGKVYHYACHKKIIDESTKNNRY